MIGSKFKIFLCATAGLLLGLIALRMQSPHVPMMNDFGVLAFASMGASLGCLTCNPSGKRR